MAQLVSKLQHKNYEKGEFSDEQMRTLGETVELINSFPWDAERPLTDVQMTGPSVTIYNDHDEYLKLGLYFNGKFCIYFLNRNKHVYEFHAPKIVDAIEKVTDFFNDQLLLTGFESHLIDINAKAHFVTNSFEYRAKPLRTLMLSWGFLFYWGFSTIMLIAVLRKPPLSPLILFTIPFFVFSAILIFILNRFLTASKMYLQLSKGHNAFSFGYSDDEIKEYHKTDIEAIIRYSSNVGSRNPNLFEVYIITFKNQEKIKFSNMLISSLDFMRKFDNTPIQAGRKSILKML